MLELEEIRSNATYHIGEAAKLVKVYRHTLLRDANNKVIKYHISPKNGRKIFIGKDLIYYRDFVK